MPKYHLSICHVVEKKHFIVTTRQGVPRLGDYQNTVLVNPPIQVTLLFVRAVRV